MSKFQHASFCYHHRGQPNSNCAACEIERLRAHDVALEKAYEEASVENERLRAEIEDWRKEAQYKEDERVRLTAALERIANMSKGYGDFEDCAAIARAALAEDIKYVAKCERCGGSGLNLVNAAMGGSPSCSVCHGTGRAALAKEEE